MFEESDAAGVGDELVVEEVELDEVLVGVTLLVDVRVTTLGVVAGGFGLAVVVEKIVVTLVVGVDELLRVVVPVGVGEPVTVCVLGVGVELMSGVVGVVLGEEMKEAMNFVSVSLESFNIPRWHGRLVLVELLGVVILRIANFFSAVASNDVLQDNARLHFQQAGSSLASNIEIVLRSEAPALKTKGQTFKNGKGMALAARRRAEKGQKEKDVNVKGSLCVGLKES